MTAQRPPVASCRSCWAPIIWATTGSGKKIPVDVEPSEGGNIVLSPGPRPMATVVSHGGREPGTTLHCSHFATCKNADQHRNPQAARRAAPPAMPQDGLFSEVER